MLRATKLCRVDKRSAKAPYDLAQAQDFELSFIGDLNELPKRAIPYCTDFVAERFWFVTVDDPAAALSAPFVYRSLYEQAVEAVSVPAEKITAPASAPLLIFSIGRCGSTLLSALLNAAGTPSVSEPDFLCQPALIAADKIGWVGAELIDKAIRVGADRFSALSGGEVAIKFRSQCNPAVALYRRVLPNARIAFILREPRAWSMSVYRAFAEPPPPPVMVRHLKEGVLAYDQLVESR